MKTRLDDAGRIELPDFVQMRLGVKPGDELALDEEDGKWFIKPAKSGNGSRESRRPDGACDVAPCPEPPRTVHPPADSDADDLHWEELDYQQVPLKRAGQVAVRVEHRGQLKPLAHNLDEE